MKSSGNHLNEPSLGWRHCEQGSGRTALLLLVSFCLGLGVAAWWWARANHTSTNGGEARPPALSAGTEAVLKRLDAPLDLRLYSILDPATVSSAVQAFSVRVDQLISQYQQVGNGKIQVTRFNAASAGAAKAATDDGIKPFNMDKGDACFLGIAVTLQGHKEVLPQLSPEWESALEPDLSRAIGRLEDLSQPPAPSSAAAAKAEAAATEEVKRAVPNFSSVSLEEGTRVLREKALEEFQAAASDLQREIQEAQQRLGQAQNGGSPAEQQAAMKHLQELQATQTEKLQQIAANSKAQIQALERLKAGRQ